MRYTVRAAARATGVSESRLRTWERRYGVPRPLRSPSGRRLYEESDLALIRRMASFIDAGMSAAQAAEASRADAEQDVHPPLGRLTAVAHPATALLVGAAVAYDERRAVAAIRTAFEELGPAAAFEEVLFPALSDMGRGWQRGELSVATEHFASELIRCETLSAVAAAPTTDRATLGVLLACPANERHDLALTALWLILRQAGVAVLYLGPDVPTPDLLEAVHASDPDVVAMSGTAPASVPALAAVGRALLIARVRARLFVGGPALGYSEDESSQVPGIRLPPSLSESSAVLIGAATKFDGRARAFSPSHAPLEGSSPP